MCDCYCVLDIATVHVAIDTDDDGGTGVIPIASVVTVITCALLNISWLLIVINRLIINFRINSLLKHAVL